MGQFNKTNFVKPLVKLKKNKSYVYPANAYATIYSIRREIEDYSIRLYTDRALNETHRYIYRIL